ncbi:MAG: DUF177 domain-containing protein [Prolixibacteraceae bacterium]|nr:DUF177 domain-containing protein [Prolixibacteraceae bacterium]
MGKTSQYSIAFKGLKEGIHEFEYKIGNKFFELFDKSLVEKANILAKVKFEKRSNLLTLFFHLKGTVELICDRCLDKYNQPVEIKTSLFVKFGENRFDDIEDVLWISPDEDFIDVAQLFYEYAVLSIPARHVHPKNKDGKRMCDPEMLDQIKKYKLKEKEQEPDHRWDALKKLRNNN